MSDSVAGENQTRLQSLVTLQSRTLILAIVLPVTVTSILTAVIVSSLSHGSTPNVPGISSPAGELRVNLNVITSKTESSESWEGVQLIGVVAIDFHPSYIVVRDKKGSGRVYSLERIKSLYWSLETAKEKPNSP